MEASIKFWPNDKVMAPTDAHKDRWRMKVGTVVKVYGKLSRPVYDYDRDEVVPAMKYPEVYDVLWEDGKVEVGLLPHGIWEAKESMLRRSISPNELHTLA